MSGNPRSDPASCDECGRWLTVRCSVDGHKGDLGEYLDPLRERIAVLEASLKSADRDSIAALDRLHVKIEACRDLAQGWARGSGSMAVRSAAKLLRKALATGDDSA